MERWWRLNNLGFVFPGNDVEGETGAAGRGAERKEMLQETRPNYPNTPFWRGGGISPGQGKILLNNYLKLFS